jgi:hypothetical protein
MDDQKHNDRKRKKAASNAPGTYFNWPVHLITSLVSV